MFCVLQRILQCGLSGALGLIGKETLTDVDNGPTMRDLLKEMVKLRSGKILFFMFFILSYCQRRMYRNAEDILDEKSTGTRTQPCSGGRVT